MSERKGNAKQIRAEDYGVAVMDGAYCNVKPDVSTLVFYQDVTSPSPSSSDPSHLTIEERTRILKFEIRVSTSNLLDLCSKIAGAWGMTKALDSRFQEQGDEEGRDPLWREGIWAVAGFNLEPPEFTKGPKMNVGTLISTWQESRR